MMNFGSLLGILGAARRNPQQAVMQMIQNAYASGRINQSQFQAMSNTVNSGGNPNQIIQQLLNSGMVSQQDYEAARQQAASFNSQKRNF